MLFAGWIACSTPTVSLPRTDREVSVETLAPEGVLGLAGVGPGVVYALGEEWTWEHPRKPESIRFGTSGVPVAAAESQGERFVLSTEVHVLLDNGAVSVGPAALGDRDLLDLCGDADQLWLQTSTGVVVWRGDLLADLLVDGTPATGPVACEGRYLDEPVSWVADREQVHAVSASSTQFRQLATEALPGPVDSIAVDVSGRPWASVGGDLYRRRDGEWQRVRIGDAVWTVLGGARASGVWAITKQGPRYVPVGERPTVARPVSGPGIDTEPLGRWRTDDLGRLLVRDATGLHRLSVGRPLWLDGIRSGEELVGARSLTVLPSFASDVTTLSLTVLEAGVEIPVEQGEALLDANQLPGGQFTLEARVEYHDGESTVARRRFWTRGQPGAITWSSDVAPIHEGSCALCHTNTAETILDGPDAWEATLDGILSQVRSGAMPLGRPDLTAEQISVIEAWADGGFVR